MAKRPSLFGSSAAAQAAPAPEPMPVAAPAESTPVRRYPVAKTREGKRVATVYLETEALKQLQMLAIKEDTTLQELLVEGVNAVFEKRSIGRLA
jgi:hypothetical protein